MLEDELKSQKSVCILETGNLWDRFIDHVDVYSEHRLCKADEKGAWVSHQSSPGHRVYYSATCGK